MTEQVKTIQAVQVVKVDKRYWIYQEASRPANTVVSAVLAEVQLHSGQSAWIPADQVDALTRLLRAGEIMPIATKRVQP